MVHNGGQNARYINRFVRYVLTGGSPDNNVILYFDPVVFLFNSL